MKKLINYLLFIILFSLPLNANVSFSKDELTYIKNNKVKAAILADFPPFTVYRNSKLSGYSHDVLELISKISGLQIEYEVAPWPENLQKFKNKEVDIIDSISFRESRLSFTNYSKPYYEIPLEIFSRKELKNYNGLESLRGKKIGVIRNVFIKKHIVDLGLFKVIEYDTFLDKLKALANGDIDVMVGHQISTHKLIEENNYTNLKALAEFILPTLSKEDLRFGITKGNELLYNIIRKSYSLINESEWNKLNEKWLKSYIPSEDMLGLTEKEYEYISNNEIKVAMLSDFPPFSIYKEKKLSGYSYDILELISKKSGLRFKYEIDKWPINLKKFKEKEVDLIDAISYREQRLDFTNFTKPYYEVPLVIFSRKEFLNYTGLESLKGRKLGITKGIFYKKQVENLDIFEIVEYESFQDKLKALAFGEVDVIFGHLLSTQIAINKSQYTNMKVLDELNLPNLRKTDLRFGMTKENDILYSIVNKTFDVISEKEWRTLENKWISIYQKDERIKKFTGVELTENERNFLIENKIDCVITSSWAPFNFLDDGKLEGIAFDYWNLIKEKTLINSKCRVVSSFDEVLDLIKNKKADISLSTAITDDKLEYGSFSLPYVSYPIAIATTLDKRYISETSFLNKRKVAVGKSYSSHRIIKDKYPDIDFIEVENNYEAFKLLSKGEVYAVVDILPVLTQTISDNGFKNTKISGTTEFNFDVRIFSRNDYGKELIPIINKGISSITQSEKQTIKNRWTSVKYEKVIDYSSLWEVGIIVLILLIVLFYRQQILNKHNSRLQEANHEIEFKTNQLQEKTKQLASQKELFEKIYYESSDGILLSKFLSDKMSDCNEAAYRLLDYESKEEFLSLSPPDVVPLLQADGSYSLDIIAKMLYVAKNEGTAQFELVHIRKDKSEIWLEVVLTSIILDNEDFIHVVWRDIDNRKNMEYKLNILTNKLEEKVKVEVKKNEEKTKQLIQQSRLAQMGEMISMIAHQWRQPLAAISATTNNLLVRMMIDEKIEKKELENEMVLISDYSQHLSMTIDDFRNFFKTDNHKTETTLDEIVKNSISIVNSSLDSEGIAFNIDLKCSKILNIFATEVNQVVLNLIKNAEDALLENAIIKPTIDIKTFSDDTYAILEIEDNAGGITEDIIDKIFDPYFSTKKEKEGTGLGLYMSKIIINEHCSGSLDVSNINDGALFRVKIPLV